MIAYSFGISRTRVGLLLSKNKQRHFQCLHEEQNRVKNKADKWISLSVLSSALLVLVLVFVLVAQVLVLVLATTVLEPSLVLCRIKRLRDAASVH